jgi:hypothetical protein
MWTTGEFTQVTPPALLSDDLPADEADFKARWGDFMK